MHKIDTDNLERILNFNFFETLRESYNLEKEDLYSYIQKKNYYTQEIRLTTDQYNPLIDIITKSYSSELTGGLISKIYKMITNVNTHSTQYIKNKWEKEAGLTITDEEWEQICRTQWMFPSIL